MSKVYLSVRDIVEASQVLAEKIATRLPPSEMKGLVAILNGGVFPAYWLRKIFTKNGMECPLETIDVRSYEGYSKQGELKILRQPEGLGDGKGWVFVDEIADTGKTLEALKKLYPAALFVSLSAKPRGLEITDLNALSFAQEDWIVFPWEILEDEVA
ncbi:MAG TPA: phosphoribosyltransferase family protein [Alphaproteobacteria bacterium]|nr:phosphoribosyltransferase family protein [Alphaproteobacteria bacterium]